MNELICQLRREWRVKDTLEFCFNLPTWFVERPAGPRTSIADSLPHNAYGFSTSDPPSRILCEERIFSLDGVTIPAYARLY
jgi:hypothetical protein